MSSQTIEEIIINQPVVNVGVLGHVAHGKSTLVRSITGIRTQRYANEQKTGRTVKLGYANVKIYQCANSECNMYQSFPSKTLAKNIKCGNCSDGKMKLVNHISFVDAPGHECLMTTMLNGTAVMDAAILVVACNETVPQPQTQEHLIAAEIMGLDNILVIQNKIDLVTCEAAKHNKGLIENWVKGTCAESSPIVPISAQFGYGVQRVIESLARLKPASRKIEVDPIFACVRSFDVNKPGCGSKELKGGVIGGTLLKGTLSVGDEIEIRPGVKLMGSSEYTPLKTRVSSIFSEKTELSFAIPGGLIAIGTDLDPYFTTKDALIGSIIGSGLPDVIRTVTVKIHLLKDVEVKKIQKEDIIRVTALSRTVQAKVRGVHKKRVIDLELLEPICLVDGYTKLSISCRIKNQWRLIGIGFIQGSSAPEEVREADFGRHLPGYDELMNVIEDKCQRTSQQKMRLTIDPPIVSRQGGVRTLWENFGRIADQIEKDETHISDYVSSELGAKVSTNANRGMLLYGRFNEGDFQSILRNYVKTYCKCAFCNHMATNLQQDNSCDIIICSYCGRNNSIPSIKKLKQFRKGNKIKTI